MNRKNLFIYEDSLKFSRAAYGALTLAAFLLRDQWLILGVAGLMALGTISMKINLFYQLHVLFFKKMARSKSVPAAREYGELRFVSGATAFLLLAGFLMLYFDKWTDFAWLYILIVALLIFLACFVGFCVATLMYIFLKKVFFNKNAKHSAN